MRQPPQADFVRSLDGRDAAKIRPRIPRSMETAAVRSRAQDAWGDLAPSFSDLEYYAELARGSFTLEQTLRAHTQDLARSIGCRGLRELQLLALQRAVESGQVSAGPADRL